LAFSFVSEAAVTAKTFLEFMVLKYREPSRQFRRNFAGGIGVRLLIEQGRDCSSPPFNVRANMRFFSLAAVILASVALMGCGTVGQSVIDAYSVLPPHDGTFNGNSVNRDTAQLPDAGGGN
jgi:hypothetical protein